MYEESTGFITVFVLTNREVYDIIIHKEGLKMLFFNIISKKYIKKALCCSAYSIKVKSCVSSTNTIMKEAARKGIDEFSVLIAEKQTAGRGRLGRSFHSPNATGIYMSILLKPSEKQNPLLVTTDAAVCAARVFERLTGEKALIKWVNDIYIHKRKVCGILTEGVGEYLVLGVGINVLPPQKGFPEDIKDRAGAVFEKREPFLREKVIVEFLNEFMKIYMNPEREKLLQEYRERSFIINEEIMILNNGGEERAKALAIDNDYSLVVEKENGIIEKLISGDVSIKI